jgi:hypothetical protein
MTAALRIADPEIEANATMLAATILDHPLARRLDWQTVWVLRAIRAEDPAVRTADAVPVLRLALAVIDLAEVQLGLEVRG